MQLLKLNIYTSPSFSIITESMRNIKKILCDNGTQEKNVAFIMVFVSSKKPEEFLLLFSSVYKFFFNTLAIFLCDKYFRI